MKQKILLVVLILVAINVKLEAQIVNIPDAFFKTYLVNNSLINTNDDDEIQISEALAFTGGIGCSNLNISDLTGLEAFTSITELICYNNQLSSLDVSSNTSLVGIECSNNMITALNLSNNTSLEVLYCGMNQISNLDISTNIELIELTCDNNLIDSLDLSANTALMALICNDNQLNFLNVSNGNNTNFAYFDAINNLDLNCIIVDDVAYSTTNWVSIDATVTFVESQEECESLSAYDEFSRQKIEIFPNPTNGIFSVIANDFFEIKTITISNSLGKNIKKMNSKKLIDISYLPSGVYYIHIELNNGYKIIRKVIKEYKSL